MLGFSEARDEDRPHSGLQSDFVNNLFLSGQIDLKVVNPQGRGDVPTDILTDSWSKSSHIYPLYLWGWSCWI